MTQKHEASDPSRAPSQILSHTGLRGVAALLVVMYHMQFGTDQKLAFETATPFFTRSYLWVDLFFVLSGFIISYTNLADRDDTPSLHEVRQFFGARLARVYPLHLFCLAYLAIFLVAIVGIALVTHRSELPTLWRIWTPGMLVAQVFLIQAWLTTSPGWNIPSWSISAELFAYLLFPVIVAFHVWQRRLTRLILASTSLAFYGYVAFATGTLDITHGLAPMRCAAGFSLGMLVFYHRHWWASLSNPVLSAMQMLATGVIVAGLAIRCNDIVLIPAFVLMVATTFTDRGILAEALKWRPFQFLGRISYSVYLNHVPLLTIASFFWPVVAIRLGASPAVLRSVFIALMIGVILIFSRWTFDRIENPARQLIYRRILHRRPPPLSKVPSAP